MINIDNTLIESYNTSMFDTEEAIEMTKVLLPIVKKLHKRMPNFTSRVISCLSSHL